uniref:Uncharacterized protein n=1 Tax=Arundo donax TaxID=35708 RepID=A0A0A9B2M6_ARUDO
MLPSVLIMPGPKIYN